MGPAAATLAGERKNTRPSRCKLCHQTQVVGATPAQVSRGPYPFPFEHAPQPHPTQDATRSDVQLQPKATVATSAALVARHVGADPPSPPHLWLPLVGPSTDSHTLCKPPWTGTALVRIKYNWDDDVIHPPSTLAYRHRDTFAGNEGCLVVAST